MDEDDDPDAWADYADEPVPFIEEPDDPDMWRHSMDEPEDD